MNNTVTQLLCAACSEKHFGKSKNSFIECNERSKELLSLLNKKISKIKDLKNLQFLRQCNIDKIQQYKNAIYLSMKIS